MRNVHDIAAQPPHDRAEIQVAFDRVVVSLERYGMEVWRQGAALRDLGRRSDEEILALTVQARQRPHHVPHVRANAEFRHATDVNGNLHDLNLTIEDTEEHRGFVGI